ncbi:MAG: hypothetical protein ACYC27_09800 [Armatimonadota bacterium]
MKHIYHILSIILLTIACSISYTATFPKIPDVILGVNQSGPGDISKADIKNAPWKLTDDDIEYFKSIGVNTIRIPVYPTEIGMDGFKLVWKTGDKFDKESADKWTVDWRLLDATLDQYLRHGITPYICPHLYPTANWMTIYIPEDAERGLWYTSLIVKHVHEKYGDNVIYGWYENIWKNSMEPWYSGVYRHTLSAEFPANWHRMLKTMWKGDLRAMNAAWGTNYTSFDQAPVWDMGTIKGVPADAYATRRTYDLRKAIDLLSRERLKSWRQELRKMSPGALWAGACLHDGFYGMYDTRMGNPPMCNWGITTHAETSDVLAADNYQSPNKLSAAYRTIAKIASKKGKKFMAVEMNGQSPSAFDTLGKVGGPIRGALVWCGREDAFGLIKEDGTRREESIKAVKSFLEQKKQKNSAQTKYHPGRVHVYFPEETYQNAVLKSSHLDAYDHVCDSLPAADLEPVLTSELDRFPAGRPLFVLEKHLPKRAIDALNRMGSQVVSPHTYFIDENGTRINRSYIPKDFYDELRAVKDGPALMEAFLRVEEKERNIAYRDEGVLAHTDSEYSKANEIDASKPYDTMDLIDGDPVASRVVFVDKRQHESIDIHLTKTSRIYGAFVETAFEDPGRTPARVSIQILDEIDLTWKEVSSTTEIKGDRIHIRFNPVSARYVRFDFGESTDSTGSRIMEVGVLAVPR